MMLSSNAVNLFPFYLSPFYLLFTANVFFFCLITDGFSVAAIYGHTFPQTKICLTSVFLNRLLIVMNTTFSSIYCVSTNVAVSAIYFVSVFPSVEIRALPLLSCVILFLRTYMSLISRILWPSFLNQSNKTLSAVDANDLLFSSQPLITIICGPTASDQSQPKKQRLDDWFQSDAKLHKTS